MDFPMDFWLFWICFIDVLFKVITNVKFEIRKHICIIGWCFVSQRNHKLGSMDLKIYALEKTATCDLTAYKIYRFSPKLSLWLPSQETGGFCLPPPFPLSVAETGRNNLNEDITPLLPTGVGERCSQTISNLGHATLLRRFDSPYKRKCRTNSGGPL